MKARYLIAMIATILLFWGGITAVALGWYHHNLAPVRPGDSSQQLIRVEEGESSVKVAASLHQQGVIRNPWAFRLYLRLHGISGELQAGLYRLNPSQKATEIARILSSGDTAVRSLTITGNMDLKQVNERLQQMGYSQADIEAALGANYDYSFLKDRPAGATLEGYLLPETYVTDLDTPVSALIGLILKTSDEKLSPQIREQWAQHNLNLHQGLTLASIVQKEASTPEDQRQVAQVFYKRLADGMKLESDVTFIYGAKLLGVEPTVGVDSPYNTYSIPGLPPGPIGGPEDSALEAVANPATTNYLFFIADKDGNMHFAEDETKHKQNIEEFLH